MILSSLIRDLLDDFRAPQIAIQIGILLVSWLLALAFARPARQWLKQHYAQRTGATLLAAASLARALTPLFAFLLIGVARYVLEPFTHVTMLRFALIPTFGMALTYIVFYILRRVFATDANHVGGLLYLAEKIIIVLVSIALVLYVTETLDDVLNWLEAITFPLGKQRISLIGLMQGAMWVIVTVLAAMWLGTAVEDRLMKVNALDNNFRVVLSRLSRAALIVAALLISLSLVGIDLTVLSVFGGALGVGLGLGLQKIASNYVAGFIILLDRSLRIGDMITVDKYYGAVTQIRTRFTVLRGLDGVEALVPNEMLVSSPVQNHSYTEKNVRLKVNVQISYQSDLEKALGILVGQAKAHARTLTEPLPAAYLTGFGADGLDLELGLWINDAEQGTLGVRSDINRAIWREFQLQGIDVPFPQRDVRIVSNIPLNLDNRPPSTGKFIVETDDKAVDPGQ